MINKIWAMVYGACSYFTHAKIDPELPLYMGYSEKEVSGRRSVNSF